MRTLKLGLPFQSEFNKKKNESYRVHRRVGKEVCPQHFLLYGLPFFENLESILTFLLFTLEHFYALSFL